jgi:hypothetical protein
MMCYHVSLTMSNESYVRESFSFPTSTFVYIMNEMLTDDTLFKLLQVGHFVFHAFRGRAKVYVLKFVYVYWQLGI